MLRDVKAGTGVALALVLAFGVSGCGDRGGPKVFTSVVDPVEVTVVPPQYVAEPVGADVPPTGLIAHAGDHEQVLPNGSRGLWLDDGRYLAINDCRPGTVSSTRCKDFQGLVLDLAAGTATPVPGLERLEGLRTPLHAVRRINLIVDRKTPRTT